VNFPGHEGLPDFDLHCPVLSLPRVFATTLADVPDETPYLVADPADVAAWSRRLSVLPGLRVGLVWAGNPQYSDDSRRSLWLAQLAPLAMAGVSLVSLQTGAAAHGSHPPAGMTLLDASGDLHDFADTAAAITALDLVISVDTASAHLAGALGKPVWLLNRFDSDWRWLVERDDSPWYPSMRIFRQRAFGDWDSVISAVASALTRLVGGPATTAGDGPHSTAVAPPAPRPAPAVAPKSELALTELGNALREQGRIAEARAAFVAALEANPASTVAYYNLAETQTFLPGDPCFVAMAKLAENSAVLTGTEQAQLEFALAKAHADIGAHARAAEHLLRANAIARARVPYDETSMLGLFGRIRGVFTAEMIERHAGHGDPSTTPVLIVGMPRSGTTLIEQILASHPNVFGAGELMDLPAMIYAVRDAGGAIAHFPEFAGALEPGGLRLFGAAYAKGLRDRAPSAERVTDKLPANFLHVGLVHLALPRARIIHVRRHPLDTCLSCFAKLFANELHFTYDLAELGRYYRAYERLMAHWREVLPSEAMLEVDYEDVVSDTKTQVRRLLAYCGLAWDDACLRYYESRRPVRTASAVQVRQPLFSSSIGRWKAYERMLAPLTRELQRP
jgi:tetratricopeptide (TPR) repeat protein